MAGKGKCFLILSCARSGSTSLARILDGAKNAVCTVEPHPNLNRETREMMEGRLPDARAVLKATVVKRVRENSRGRQIYGEKNVTYGPFIPHLYEMLKCKFIFLKRDGRDVVRSMMDWHERMFGSIYRECKDPGILSPRALNAAANLPVHLDTSDYARPRPCPGDPFYDEWANLSREEMCSFYWSTINELYLNALEKIPKEAWIEIDYTSPKTDDVLRVVDFLGLKGVSRDGIQELLDSRLNSLKDRTGEDCLYPDWRNWDRGLRGRFDKIAERTMERLGYYRGDPSDWRPSGYGRIWDIDQSDLGWYTWMYDGRRKMHTDLVAWVHNMETMGESIESIADFGCGLGVGYCDDFSSKKYVGVDLSQKNIRWCGQNRQNLKHRYLCLDFVIKSLPEPVDLVFSSGTLDNVYDVDACLQNMVKNARKWIYVAFYRGWFPDLEDHIYSWNEEHKCFYNDVSPSRIRKMLVSTGCRDIQIGPTRTGRSDIPFETLVIARTPEGNRENRREEEGVER